MEPYIPDRLPLHTINWEMHVSLIGKANAALARYDGILLGIINPQMLSLRSPPARQCYHHGSRVLKHLWKTSCSMRRMLGNRRKMESGKILQQPRISMR